MRCLSRLLLLVLIATLGCGGANKPNGASTKHGSGGGRSSHSGKGDEHAGGEPDRDFPPEMTAFHHGFDELWHEEASPERTAQACDRTGELQERAKAIVEAETPEKIAEPDQQTWSAATSALLVSVTALETECAAEGRAGVDHAIAGIHEAFHDLVVIWDRHE